MPQKSFSGNVGGLGIRRVVTKGTKQMIDVLRVTSINHSVPFVLLVAALKAGEPSHS
jgi:hypothetical protein